VIAEPVARLVRAVEATALLTRNRVRAGTTHDTADDVAGSIDTDDAIGFDPFPLLRALDERGACVVVMGQVAGIMHGSTELTGDLDLLWDGDRDQASLLADAFASVSATVTDAHDRPLACTTDAFLLPKVLFRSSTTSGDCCTPKLPWGVLDIPGILQRAVTVEADDGLRIHYVSAPDLVVMRRAVGRPKDLRRAADLEAGGTVPG
jgi:hypothetical protein